LTSAFEFYLRTGCRLGAIQTKFNPWHDPDDGRFTFAGQGRRFGRAEPKERHSGTRGRGGSFGGGGASTSWDADSRNSHRQDDPRNPRNHSIYRVRRGDTLTKIAGLRKGLTVADVEWLNELSAGRPLQIGQGIKLPHQQFLDAGKHARDTFLALAHYMEITGGKLPPNVARPPSIEMQIEASGRREFQSNGYRYEVDVLLRTRHISGRIRLKTEPRSRGAQTNAGKPDRRVTDDGGHFIAARFKGPREWFNHFAQDANFNRGEYRALEDRWAKAVRSSKRVFVDIVPHYRGTSLRPFKLVVTWSVDGNKLVRDFPNERQGR
jgi:LysM repeat protein